MKSSGEKKIAIFFEQIKNIFFLNGIRKTNGV